MDLFEILDVVQIILSLASGILSICAIVLILKERKGK